ncbi:MAG: OsmC family protein [Caldilineaceae bacterium]|nr:OsmC family protein [Caldilineaceae bacterium]MCB0138045.1 OsmC family protein [Caldilineaceae bacterium]
MAKTSVQWIEGKSFLGVGDNGRSVVMSPGDGPGVSPMQMLLLGLGGCTAIDIVDILQKQRQPLEDIRVEISGERGEEWPKPWSAIHIHYVITGAGLDPHKVERAIDLSVNKYCGAHATLAGVAEITHDHELRTASEPVEA